MRSSKPVLTAPHLVCSWALRTRRSSTCSMSDFHYANREWQGDVMEWGRKRLIQVGEGGVMERERGRDKIGVWFQVLQAEHFHFSLRRWFILRRIAIPLWCICVCARLPVCLCLCVHVLIEQCSLGTFKELETVHKNANVVRCWAELTQ